MKNRSGFVAIVGRPNVGKSTLVNALIGQKISITGPKAQTTRNKIMGIKTGEDYQVVFVDTPGSINPHSELDRFMAKSIEAATLGIDVLLILVDASKITGADFKLVEKYKNIGVPIVLAINKVDIASYEKVYPSLAKFNEMKFISDFVSISAKEGKNVEQLFDTILKHIPEGQNLFEKGQVTDVSERFLAAEMVREKALLFLQDEIPHGIAIDIVRFKENKSLVSIDAEIVATKQNHKQIIIGKNGDMLKRIGTSARQEIEKMTGKKVNLQIFVKVRENWQDDKLTLRELGYDKKDI